MNAIEIIEPIMGIMDKYPLTSIAFCFMIVLGMIVYKVVKYIDHKNNNRNPYTGGYN
ncbi:hypothetical protein [Arenibacter certesii]|uniref:Uncharacterized protein n=1 Tax=Arenibacter certesii TaxID=228955 RepID=A0A918J8D9_9FLAO|nr:hypothetical protein [Arenibacter certesii]GGW50663.1 hypothetical protein GCM10007383_38010 [Arenibacter certesii]